MRFGDAPLEEAAGALLAHTHRVGGRVLKKGHRLTEDDVALFRAAGHRALVVARPDPGDVHEDAAAERVARAVIGPHVEARAAHTGRANLYATRRGILAADAAAVDAINLVDESITLATLAPYALVEPGDMVATVKIIPFAVPEAALAEAERRAARPVVSVAPLAPARAGLVLTVLPDVAEAQLRRAEESQRQRLRALGGELVRVIRARHEVGAVRAAIEDLRADGASPILLLGASAITDRADVVPAAIEAAGGVVTHFGMPVDPGNLLLLAALGDTPVIGVPGCARALTPSGFDRVLERVVAGLPVGRADLMRMGAGGLMSDTDARPAPREERPRDRAPRIAAVVLAAGQSRRMGAAHKLLSDVGGRPMIRRVIDVLEASAIDEIAVVVGHRADEVRAAVGGARGLHFVDNPGYADGLSTSLRAGALALNSAVDGVLFVLGDMPWVTPEHVARLIAAFDPRAICIPVFEGRRGNPVLWASRFLPEMQKLTGDVGARPLLAAHADAVVEVPVDDRGIHFDVDTPEALRELLDAKR